MKWTPDKVALLREWAAKGRTQAMAAGAIGTTELAVNVKASKLKIAFHGHNGPQRASYDEAMGRWRSIIGPMKAALRAEVERIVAGD